MPKVRQCPECGRYFTTAKICAECEEETVPVRGGRRLVRRGRRVRAPLRVRLTQAAVGALLAGILIPGMYWATDARSRGALWDPRDDLPFAVGMVVCCALAGAIAGFMIPRGTIVWDESKRPPPRWARERDRDDRVR